MYRVNSKGSIKTNTQYFVIIIIIISFFFVVVVDVFGITTMIVCKSIPTKSEEKMDETWKGSEVKKDE